MTASLTNLTPRYTPSTHASVSKVGFPRHFLRDQIVERDFEREAPMRNLKTVAESLAAVAVIVSLGTSPVLARGRGGGNDGGRIHFVGTISAG
jgi:hypothetical protein